MDEFALHAKKLASIVIYSLISQLLSLPSDEHLSLIYCVSTFSLLLLPTPHKTTKERLLQVEIGCENNPKFSSQICSYRTTFQCTKEDFNHKTQKSGKRGFRWTLHFFAEGSREDSLQIQLGKHRLHKHPLFTAAAHQGYSVKQDLHTISILFSIGYQDPKWENIKEV